MLRVNNSFVMDRSPTLRRVPWRTSFILASALAISWLAPSAQARTWKEAGSDRTLEGDYSRTEGEIVVIIRPNGTSVKVPRAKLSEEDLKFIAEQDAAKAAATAAPSAKGTCKWETDMEVALKRAKDENKPLLLDFTGSDWCGWCIKLKDEVFDKPEFKEYAKDNLILVELDFPHGKSQSKKEKEQNQKLKQEHKVSGFPTVVLLDSDGKPVNRTGYQQGGPEKYVEHLKRLLNK